MKPTRIPPLPIFPKSCSGCGTCVGVCPKDCITMKHQGGHGIYIPELDSDRCTRCGLCLKVCPNIDSKIISERDTAGFGINPLNQQDLDQMVFGRKRTTSEADILLGIRQFSGVGYSLDQDARWKGSSGGMVSTLLVYLLENNLIDGVITVGFLQNEEFPKAMILRTKGEILANQGSTYCAVPLNEIFKTVLTEEGRYAIVCLPCQLHSLRLAQRFMRKLKDRIRYVFTLFCSGNIGTKGTSLLRDSLEIERVCPVTYRGLGWPGGFSKKTLGQPEKLIPYHSYFTTIRSYTPTYCFLCLDAAGEFSDISFGDAWLPEYREDKTGVSMFIVRTDNGRDLIEKAITDGKIQIEKISDDDVLRARATWKNKKQAISLRSFLGKLWYGSTPSVQFIAYPGGGFSMKARLIFWHIRSFIASNSFLSRTYYNLLMALLKKKIVTHS
jgi:coenzyme F420 hydrogenase subunit beta